MIKQFKGDLLKSDCPVICHQVNCLGIMGAGIAKSIKLMYPNVFSEYVDMCSEANAENLGKIQIVRCKERTVINLFGQNLCGYGQCQTDYEAFEKCVKKIASMNYARIGFPYKIGCGLAGGDWNKIYEIFERYFGDSKTICEFYQL